MDAHTLDVLEVKASEPCRTTVSYQEFVNLVRDFAFHLEWMGGWMS